MSVTIASCWISVNVLLGFILIVGGEHFYLPKANNVISNDLQEDWVPISGIDKRSTRPNHGITKVVHITPPVRYPNRLSNQQAMAASNKVEVFAQPPPTILGSFSEFGHATIKAREPAHTLNFRPSYHFDRHHDEINDRRYQQNDYLQEPDDQTPPAIVVFNAQQRHPQKYLKPTPPPPPPPSPPQYYQNFPYHNNNINNHNNNFGFKEPPAVQEATVPPKILSPYFVPNDHVFPRPQQQGNSKQVYAEQRPKPYLVTSVDPIQQQHQQYYQQPQRQQQKQQHYQQTQQQQQQQQQQQHQKQPYKTSATEGVQSSAYFHKYPGHVIDAQNLFPEVSNFARPFEQTNDHSVYIKPNQHVHSLSVGTGVRFGPPEQPTRAAVPQQEPTTTGITHPATRPFSKYQTPTPKNEELYRIFPVKEVNALTPFLPTPITLQTLKAANGRPKAPYPKDMAGGSSEYDAREEFSQNENDSGEQYDIMRSPTKPMTTTTTTVAPLRATRKKKPSTTTTTATTTTTTTAAAPLDEYDEYAVPNRQQLQLQEHQQPEYEPQQQQYLPHKYRHQQRYEPTTTTEPNKEIALPVSVNKYKKKKPLPAARPKEPQPEELNESPEHAAFDPPGPASSTAATTTATAAAVTTTASTTTTTVKAPQSSAEAASTDVRTKTKLKYGNGTRPRFSIKDYKTTTSTTTTTSTEKAPSGRRTAAATTTPAAPTTDADTATTGRKPYRPRLRPNRYRATSTTSTEEPRERPAETTTTTTTTDRTAHRSKYKPGKYYNRLRTSTAESATVAAAAEADEGGETAVAATEPTKPAVYSAKRRTVPSARTTPASSAEESNALRRSSSAAPLIGGAEETLDAASSEDVDYVTTTATAVTPSRHKYHTTYSVDRPLLPIESFFQSSMAGKRHHHHAERR